jgi:hypothetical protein
MEKTFLNHEFAKFTNVILEKTMIIKNINL